MPKSKKLEKLIGSKLEKLQKLLDKFDEVRVINSDDSETWDSDTLYNLVENLKDSLKLLEDKIAKGQFNEWGEPIVLEEGLCSLVDEYHREEEESNDYV